MNVYWLEQRAADIPAHNEWLSEAEAARLGAMRFPKRRADWRLGRWTAKRALAACLHARGDSHALAEIEIRPAPCGAPEVFLAGQPAPVTISLSHRDGIAVCAIASSGAALGCDLELVEPRTDAFVADYFTSEEQLLVARTSAADRLWIVALLWSAKESALKALREGLRLDTRSVIATPEDVLPFQAEAVALCATHSWHPLRVNCADAQVFYGWWQHTGDLLRTLVAAPPPELPIFVESSAFDCALNAAPTIRGWRDASAGR